LRLKVGLSGVRFVKKAFLFETIERKTGKNKETPAKIASIHFAKPLKSDNSRLFRA
jgi:hypothetical protein